MSVTAYVLIQTEVGRAEKVAKAARDIAGVVNADNVAGPYDVIVKARSRLARRARPARRVGDPEGRRHHPHLHLPHRQPVDSLALCEPGYPARGRSLAGELLRFSVASEPWYVALLPLTTGAGGAAVVAGDRQVDEPVEQLGVGHARRLPETRVHRDRREARESC